MLGKRQRMPDRKRGPAEAFISFLFILYSANKEPLRAGKFAQVLQERFFLFCDGYMQYVKVLSLFSLSPSLSPSFSPSFAVVVFFGLLALQSCFLANTLTHMSDEHKRVRFVKPIVHWYQW